MSAMLEVDIEHKLGAFERLPAGGGLRAMFRTEDAVDYYDGEQPPE